MSDQPTSMSQESQTAQSMSPQPEVEVAAPVRHRVHHSFIWLGSIQAAFAIFVVVLISGISSIAGLLAKGTDSGVFGVPTLFIVVLCIIVGFILVVGIVALFQWLSYKHLYYELGVSEFNLYSGIFNKKRVHVPYQRIQSVDQHASLLQRVFGVCSVSIDTAGGSANKAVMVPYMQKAQAEQLRTELFARKQFVAAVQSGVDPASAAAVLAAGIMPQTTVPLSSAGASVASGVPHNVLDAPAEIWTDVRGVFGGMAVDTGKVSYEYGLTNKELILTGLSNNTAFVLIIVGILGAVAQLVGEIAPILAGRIDPLVGQVVAMSSQLFSGNLIAGIIAVVVIAIVVIWIFSIVGTCISFGGFRACRRDSRIEVEHGLLQHRFQGVDIARVQSVVVKQSFIRRLLGYCELSLGKIDAASENQQDQQKSLSQQGVIIHPFVKMNRVPEILAGLVPEFADVPIENTPVAPVALRRALVRRGIVQGEGFWLAIILVVVQLCVNAFVPATAEGVALLFYVNTGAAVGYALCVVLLVLNLIGAVLWFRGSGFAYNQHFMQVSNGGFSRESVSFPRKKIQFGYTKTNPLQRNAKTATVSARTAAGIGGTTIRLVDVCEDDARAWLDWLKPHGNVLQ
ncbi:MAG: PH domain-containing protein [Gordonibacter sp.]|nr:PH domain-containing protein [Gordonibacter sp.]